MSSRENDVKNPDPRPYRAFYNSPASATASASDSTTLHSTRHRENSDQVDADAGTLVVMATVSAAVTGVAIFTATTVAAGGHP